MNAIQIVALVDRCTHRLVHNKALSCWTVEAYSVRDAAWLPGVLVQALDGFNASAVLTLYPTNQDVTYYYASERAALTRLADSGEVVETNLPLPLRYTLSLARSRGLVEFDERHTKVRLSADGRAVMAATAGSAA